MCETNLKPFRGLDSNFLDELKTGKLRYIREFERKHRKSFIVEIRDNFLDLYFLGHGIEVKRSNERYFFSADKAFNPKPLLPAKLKNIVKDSGNRKWQIFFDEIEEDNSSYIDEIMTSIILKIVEHRKGNISEGVSEINHFIDNRTIKKNGILVIDRQVVCPRTNRKRIDLLGLKRLKNGKFTFVVLELKNKNNSDMATVFTQQVKRYIDIVYNHYEHFRVTYEEVLNQKIELGLLSRFKFKFATKGEVSIRDIEGVFILDNYIIRSDLRDDGMLHKALKDWESLKRQSDEYNAKLFLKTNILDSTFFMDYQQTDSLVKKYKRNN